jgi:hypothetical protein
VKNKKALQQRIALQGFLLLSTPAQNR